MRFKKYLLAIVGIALMLSLSGCGKTWAVTFTITTDLDPWAQTGLVHALYSSALLRWVVLGWENPHRTIRLQRQFYGDDHF